MHFTNFIRTAGYSLALISLPAISQASPAPAEKPPPDRFSDPLAADLAAVHKIPIHEHARSAPEREQAAAIVDRLNQANDREAAEAFIAAVRDAKAEREVVDYRVLLPKLPRIKDHILRRINVEQDPMLKGRLIICVGKLKGADVVKRLFAQLDDKRPVDSRDGPSTLRICDYAFDIIYVRVAHIPELGLDHSSDMSDSIVRDVRMGSREARIAKLKKGLTEKFGPDLHLLEEF